MSEATRDPGTAVERLRAATRVLITSHASPDGDALGSELGFAEMAGRLGLATTILNRDPHPAPLALLRGIETIQVVPELPPDLEERFDLAVVLECPDLDRPALAGLERLPLLNIDHHLDNTLYGEVNYIDDDAPAVGEMVLAMADAASVAVTETMASNLYVALVTDTGDFRYSNATPRAFAAAERLVRFGAKPHEIAEALWERTPARVIRLTGAVLSTLELLADGRLAVIECDRARLAAAGADPGDTEDIINIPRSIDGVRAVAFFKAFRDGLVRVSLRSRGDLDVQSVARSFGGGGHRNAAGCSVEGTLEHARSVVLTTLLPLVEPS
jgi:phosphoesterase RecJ-like protein